MLDNIYRNKRRSHSLEKPVFLTQFWFRFLWGPRRCVFCARLTNKKWTALVALLRHEKEAALAEIARLKNQLR